jgi:hypothetical protein
MNNSLNLKLLSLLLLAWNNPYSHTVAHVHSPWWLITKSERKPVEKAQPVCLEATTITAAKAPSVVTNMADKQTQTKQRHA